MEKKIFKILFILSFLPYPLILAFSVFSAFNGISFFFSTSYGWEAFQICIIFIPMLFTIYYPVIPICILYDILYLFRKKIFRFTPSKKFYKIASIIFVIGSVVMIVIAQWDFITMTVENRLMKHNFNKMLKYVDEEVVYDKSNIYVSGILDNKDYPCGTLFLDTDKMEIGILSGYNFGEYHQYQFNKITDEQFDQLKQDYYFQCKVRFPSGELFCYSKNEEVAHYTSTFAFMDNEGQCYSTKLLKGNGILTFLHCYQSDEQ